MAGSPSPDIKALARRIERAQRARAAADQAWRAAIVAGHEGGLSSRRIGELVGLSHSRVQDIINEEKTS